MNRLAVMLNETRKALLILWDYRFSTLMEFFMIGMVFAGVLLFTGQGQLLPEQLTSALLGFLLTIYVMETLSRMSFTLMGEAQAGTLEQMYMSPVSSAFLLTGQTLASFIVATGYLLIIVPALMFIFDIQMALPLASLPIILLTLVGVAGFGFLMAGMTIVFKQVGPLSNMLSNLLLFVNGTFLPVDRMPDWLASAAKIMPSTQGIVALRQVATDGMTLAQVWSDGTLVFLAVHSVFFLVAGWLVFRWCEDVARRRGTLGYY